jgi:hypothetical protein
MICCGRVGDVSVLFKSVFPLKNFLPLHVSNGVRGGAVVEAPRYKPEGRGIDF